MGGVLRQIWGSVGRGALMAQWPWWQLCWLFCWLCEDLRALVRRSLTHWGTAFFCVLWSIAPWKFLMLSISCSPSYNCYLPFLEALADPSTREAFSSLPPHLVPNHGVVNGGCWGFWVLLILLHVKGAAISLEREEDLIGPWRHFFGLENLLKDLLSWHSENTMLLGQAQNWALWVPWYTC